MSSTAQTFIALAIVALVLVWFARRALRMKRNPGCGSDCSCAPKELKAKLRR